MTISLILKGVFAKNERGYRRKISTFGRYRLFFDAFELTNLKKQIFDFSLPYPRKNGLRKKCVH